MLLVLMLVYFGEQELGQGNIVLVDSVVLELEVDYRVAEYCILDIYNNLGIARVLVGKNSRLVVCCESSDIIFLLPVTTDRTWLYGITYGLQCNHRLNLS